MNEKKIIVIGHFGLKNNQLDGQTIKTRTIYKSLINSGLKVTFLDVSYRCTMSNIIKFLYFFLFIKEVVILPGKNQLRFWLKLITFLDVIFRKRIHYIVVGGWLPSFIGDNKNIIKKIKRFTSISCETQSMVRMLSNKKIDSQVLVNFRSDKELVKNLDTDNNIFKFYFLSRIIKEKGIFEAIEFYKKFKGKHQNSILKIYGPCLLSENEKNKFYREINSNIEIEYLGELQPEEITDEISKLDIMLFPTFYQGEGFPGVIVDAKFAGTTVIASNWNYNNEIINNTIDGCIIDFNDHIQVNKAINYISDRNIVNEMKIKSFNSSCHYVESNVMNNWIKLNLNV